mmetsp:Transcript_12125/g.30700  ORF Transcript_12125/g.30700 Transcript_12125/m.30700 type:complete len:113 (+) Transcript_12125:767-1105(+)
MGLATAPVISGDSLWVSNCQFARGGTVETFEGVEFSIGVRALAVAATVQPVERGIGRIQIHQRKRFAVFAQRLGGPSNVPYGVWKNRVGAQKRAEKTGNHGVSELNSTIYDG